MLAYWDLSNKEGVHLVSVNKETNEALLQFTENDEQVTVEIQYTKEGKVVIDMGWFYLDISEYM